MLPCSAVWLKQNEGVRFGLSGEEDMVGDVMSVDGGGRGAFETQSNPASLSI